MPYDLKTMIRIQALIRGYLTRKRIHALLQLTTQEFHAFDKSITRMYLQRLLPLIVIS